MAGNDPAGLYGDEAGEPDDAQPVHEPFSGTHSHLHRSNGFPGADQEGMHLHEHSHDPATHDNVDHSHGHRVVSVAEDNSGDDEAGWSGTSDGEPDPQDMADTTSPQHRAAFLEGLDDAPRLPDRDPISVADEALADAEREEQRIYDALAEVDDLVPTASMRAQQAELEHLLGQAYRVRLAAQSRVNELLAGHQASVREGLGGTGRTGGVMAEPWERDR
jgi:hypothetical protein